MTLKSRINRIFTIFLILNSILSGIPLQAFSDASSAPSLQPPAAPNNYSCGDICGNLLDPTKSITTPGAVWNAIDDQLCNGMLVTNSDPSCTVGAKPEVLNLASQVNTPNASDPCSKLKRIYEYCQNHANPSQVQQHCAVYNGMISEHVLDKEYGMIAEEVITDAACGAACAMENMTAATLGATASALPPLEAACATLSIGDAITELSISMTMGQNGTINDYLNQSSVLGMDPSTMTAAMDGASKLSWPGLKAAYQKGANAISAARSGGGAATGAADSAGSAAGESASSAAGDTAGHTAADTAGRKATEVVAEDLAKAGAKEGGKEAASAAGKKTLGAMAKNGAKLVGEKLGKLAGGSCLDTIMMGITTALRAKSIAGIKGVSDQECKIIQQLGNTSTFALNATPGANTFSAAGVMGTGGLMPGTTSTSSTPSGGSPQAMVTGFINCIQGGTDPSNCASSGGLPALSPSAATAIGNLFSKPDIASQITANLPNIDSVISSIAAGNNAAASAALTHPGLPDEFSSKLKGLEALVLQESQNFGPIDGLTSSSSLPGTSNKLGINKSITPATDPFAAMLLEFEASRKGKRKPASTKTQVINFKKPAVLGDPTGGSDIWHSNWQGSLFEIVSSRVVKASTRVLTLEWVMPMNRATHGLRNTTLVVQESLLRKPTSLTPSTLRK